MKTQKGKVGHILASLGMPDVTDPANYEYAESIAEIASSSVERGNSKDRPTCEGKTCYESQNIANQVRIRVMKKRGTAIRVYFCDTCKSHHLTSQTKRR